MTSFPGTVFMQLRLVLTKFVKIYQEYLLHKNKLTNDIMQHIGRITHYTFIENKFGLEILSTEFD